VWSQTDSASSAANAVIGITPISIDSINITANIADIDLFFIFIFIFSPF
jgi:hypothetical protein